MSTIAHQCILYVDSWSFDKFAGQKVLTLHKPP